MPARSIDCRELAPATGCLRDTRPSQGDVIVAVMSETLSALVSPTQRRGHPALFVGMAGDAPRQAGARLGLRGIDRVDIGRGDARRFVREHVDDVHVLTVTLADPRLSTRHARISRIGRSWVLEDLESKNGTWVHRRRIGTLPLEDGVAFVVGHTAFVYRADAGDAPDLDGQPASVAAGFATMAPRLESRFEELATAARTAVPVEIRGETGSGKELSAQAVHQLSQRSGKFVAINCGAIAPNLLEAELFGHRRGAYTGATEDRLGLVRTADGGTLFLDEVAELPATSQTALLRVLESREVTPVGADRPVKVDVRVITATHKDLDAEVEAGRFRADLRARLLGVQLEMPALRDRREDLGLLAAALLDRHAPGREVGFYADAVAALYAHDWPLNIRELDRALAGALAVTTGRIELSHLPGSLREQRSEPVPVDVATLSDEDREIRESLVAALARHHGNVAAIARELGKDRTQIRRWLKRFRLSKDGGDS